MRQRTPTLAVQRQTDAGALAGSISHQMAAPRTAQFIASIQSPCLHCTTAPNSRVAHRRFGGARGTPPNRRLAYRTVLCVQMGRPRMREAGAPHFTEETSNDPRPFHRCRFQHPRVCRRRIAVARNRYIKSVQDYNVATRSFPSYLTAMVFGYAVKANFTVTDEKVLAAPPTVSFGASGAKISISVSPGSPK